MLTIHHLGLSQSERIVWLCEELGLPYRLVRHERDPVTRLSPPALLALHPTGAAPVIEDGPVLLAESGAIAEYILARYGGGRLAPAPTEASYPDYLYWLHFANGSLQPALMRLTTLRRAETPPEHPAAIFVRGRLARLLGHMEERLGSVPFLAGPDVTAADIMTVFSLTTMRVFAPFDLAPYPNIRAYLARIGEREGYRRAMQAGDPDLTPLLA